MVPYLFLFSLLSPEARLSPLPRPTLGLVSSSIICNTITISISITKKSGLDWSYLVDGLRSGGHIRLSGAVELVIEGIEKFRPVTVNIEPPVTDEVLLVEQSPIGTEEAVLGQSSCSVTGADVEGLTVSLWVSIVASVKSSSAVKRGVGDLLGKIW